MQTARRFSRYVQPAGKGYLAYGGAEVCDELKRLAPPTVCSAGATHGGSVGLEGIVSAATRSVRVRAAWCVVALRLVRKQSDWYFDPHASLGLRMAALRVWMPSFQPLRAACGFGLLWRAVALKLVMNQSEWYFDPHASLGLRMAALRVWMPSL